MNVTDTIRVMIREYPGLFPNRTAAMQHLFLVIGNGYEWSNGEIADVFADTPKRERHVEQMKWFATTSATISDAAGTLALVHGPVINWYPPSDYALILNIPDDATEDWKLGAVEMCCAMYGEHFHNRSKELRDWIDRIYDYQLFDDEFKTSDRVTGG